MVVHLAENITPTIETQGKTIDTYEPQLYTCHKIDKDTWVHLLSLCEKEFLKGPNISRHNAPMSMN